MRSTYSRRIRFEQLESRSMLAVVIQGDYDNSGVVDNNDYTEWRTFYGEVGDMAPWADGNADGSIDAADYVVWRKNLGRVAPPNAPAEISAAAIGSTSVQVSWASVSGATSYSVQRRAPDTESEFTTIASGLATTSHTDNTATSNTLYEYRVVASSVNGDSPPSKTAQAVTNRANLTAYRPQSVHDPVSAPNAPIYDRPTTGGQTAGFPKKEVLEQDELSTTLGPGIRVNLDDDNLNGIADASPLELGAIPLENDLIEVKVDRLPGQGNLVLDAGPNLALYYDYDKGTPIPLAPGGATTVPLTFTDNSVTVFVEWVNFDHGTDTLSLVDQATGTPQDTIRFHSFRSIIVVFGGRGQNPRDTDGDGNIGDVVQGANREGIFDTAQALYETGWDVLPFEVPYFEQNINNVIGFAEIEIANAVFNRNVGNFFDYMGGVSVMGYSWGGGATFELIESLWNNYEITTLYGVYLDAVDHFTPFSETRWPDDTFYLLNIYHNNILPGFRGAEIPPEDVFPGSVLEDINTTTEPGFPGNLRHGSIDDDADVKERIIDRLHDLMLR